MAERREQAIIKNFLVVMAVADIADEVIEIFKNSVNHVALDTHDSDEEEDLLEVSTLISECQNLAQDGDSSNLKRLHSLIDRLVNLPASVAHPYSQQFRFVNGGSRMTNENWQEKFQTEVYLELFRFRKCDMFLLAEALEIPDAFISGNGYQSSKMEGLHILLRRLASPCRWVDIAPQFYLTPQSMSVIFNGLLTLLFRKWGDFIRTLDHEWLDADHLREYAAAYVRMDCPLRNCILSIDGTKHCFSRPGHGLQGACFCGHWGEHCMGYQVIQLPNGHNLCFGPFNGFEHDSRSVKMIELEDKLCDKLREHGTEYVAYLDSGYALGHVFITPYSRRRALTAEEKEFNRTDLN